MASPRYLSSGDKPVRMINLNNSVVVRHKGPQKNNLNSTGCSCAAPKGMAFLHWMFVLLVIPLGGQSPPGPPPDLGTRLEAALADERDGRFLDAFQAFLNMPYGGPQALRLSHLRPADYLSVARRTAEEGGLVGALVLGDLCLAQGDRAGALGAYRLAAQRLSKDGYAVKWEPGGLEEARVQYRLHPPFSLGSGGHRDNWLLRRFLGLEAWEDAAQEFRRVWDLHLQRAKDGGLDGLGLEFTLDYAYFLKRYGRGEAALEHVLEVLCRVDMDRNVNSLNGYLEYPFPTDLHGGSSRLDFLRLAYGLFSSEGRGHELLQVVAARASQLPVLFRVLARLHMLAEAPDAALGAELAYLRAAGFNPLSTTFRRGRVFEVANRLPEAIEALEACRTQPFSTLDLPDHDEGTVARWATFATGMPQKTTKAIFSQAGFQVEVLQHLMRLYTAQGQKDQVLRCLRETFEVDPKQLTWPDPLLKCREAHKNADRSGTFDAWVRERLTKTSNPSFRATLLWALGEPQAVIHAVVLGLGQAEDPEPWRRWAMPFRDLGGAPHRAFMRVMVRELPRNAGLQLRCLEAEGRTDGPEVIHALESMLEERALTEEAFPVAHRLMRQYARAGRQGDQLQLALRLAKGRAPFQEVPKRRDHSENGPRESGLAALSLAISNLRDPHALDALEAALVASPWTDALRQLRRRRGQGFPSTPAFKPFPWVNLPQGVTLLASLDDVLDLTRDDRHVYSGHPWGVAVHDFSGRPVVRIPLGRAVTRLVVVQGALWAGTEDGLFRIDPKTYEVAEVPLVGSAPYRTLGKCIQALVARGEVLWIGTDRDLRTLDTRTGELTQLFEVFQGVRHLRFLGPYVWADHQRFDTRTGLRSAPLEQSADQMVTLVGRVDGLLWGLLSLRRTSEVRLCHLDPETLAVTVVPVVSSHVSDQMGEIDGRFCFLGRLRGEPVFGNDTENLRLRYDPAARRLVPFDQNRSAPLVPEWEEGLNPRTDGVVAKPRRLLRLPDGTCVLGGGFQQLPRGARDPNPPTIPGSMLPVGGGGLYWVGPGQQVRRMSLESGSGLPAGKVNSVLLDAQERSWLCTEGGLCLLDAKLRPLGTFDSRDGLLGDGVTQGVAVGARLLFANRLGTDGGGLLQLDLRTSVFTTLTKEDGLPSDRVVRLERVGRQVRIACVPPRFKAPQKASVLFDPEKDRIRGIKAMPPAGTFTEALQEGAWDSGKAPGQPGALMPFLGGRILHRSTLGGRTFLCGTHGVVVLEKPRVVEHPWVPVPVTTRMGPELLQVAEAREWKSNVPTQEELTGLLNHPNPFLIANALATWGEEIITSHGALVQHVGNFATHPHLRVRSTAVLVLAKSKDPRALAALKGVLKDSNAQLRAVAALALARGGAEVDLGVFEEILSFRWEASLPFGVSSMVGVDPREAIPLLATRADAAGFALLLRRCQEWRHNLEDPKILADLGTSLRNHPDAAPQLLQMEEGTPLEGRMAFVGQVFKAAGPGFLPVLHGGLQSPQRLVRALAAHACGCLGDPSSIPPLIESLDLESGLSRYYIIQALGRLKAREALPKLIRIFAQVRTDEVGRAGFRRSQLSAVQEADYASLGNLETLSLEWDGLQARGKAPADPRMRQLEARHIQEAVAAIGPSHCQAFFRALARDQEGHLRRAAAQGLGASDPLEREASLAVLRTLLTDGNAVVRMAAAVSLVNFEVPQGCQLLRRQIGEASAPYALDELERVKDPSHLGCIRTQLEAWMARPEDYVNTRTRIRTLLNRLRQALSKAS